MTVLILMPPRQCLGPPSPRVKSRGSDFEFWQAGEIVGSNQCHLNNKLVKFPYAPILSSIIFWTASLVKLLLTLSQLPSPDTMRPMDSECKGQLPCKCMVLLSLYSHGFKSAGCSTACVVGGKERCQERPMSKGISLFNTETQKRLFCDLESCSGQLVFICSRTQINKTHTIYSIFNHRP